MRKHIGRLLAVLICLFSILCFFPAPVSAAPNLIIELDEYELGKYYFCSSCGNKTLSIRQVIQAPTCSKPGYGYLSCSTRTCYRATTEVKIKSNGQHAFVYDSKNCEADMTCYYAGCTATQKSTKTHNWVATGDCTKGLSCSVCSVNKQGYTSHNFTAPSSNLCQNPGCSVERNFNSDVANRCSKCGQMTLKIAIWTPPTCVTEGKGNPVCQNSKCQYEGAPVTIPATGQHDLYATKVTDKRGNDASDCTKSVTCMDCGGTYPGQRTHILSDTSDAKKPGCAFPGCTHILSEQEKQEQNMGVFAFQIYKWIRAICVPMAIISFASCGFRFIGSILLGNYANVAGNDILKARKQMVYTAIAIMFIILLPYIYGTAISFFEKTGWKPPT